MGASFLITLREGFEGALIVAIVMAYLRQVDRQDTFKYVWIGTAAALAVSAAIGVVAWSALGGLTGNIRQLVFGCICLAAVGVLTWMIFWMKRQARSLSRELRAQVDKSLRQGGSMIGIASIPFIAVLREGIETVLFLIAVLAGTTTRDFAVGGLLGLVCSVILGVAVYQSGRRLNLRLFFTLTGWLVLIIAAGLSARGVAWLQEAQVLPTFWWPVWDLHLTPIIGYGTVAQFLSGLLGWNPRPSIEEVSAWVIYILAAGWYFTGGLPLGKPASAPTPRPATSTLAS
jgi:high-affinity iron transporter